MKRVVPEWLLVQHKIEVKVSMVCDCYLYKPLGSIGFKWMEPSMDFLDLRNIFKINFIVGIFLFILFIPFFGD
jgi:hypothetical protein